MKKVICIDGKPRVASFHLPEGVPLNVFQSDVYDNCYLVEGYMWDSVRNNVQHWDKKRFVPISEIDETEMERNYNLQVATSSLTH